MKKTIRKQIHEPYSLHDMNVIAFEATGNDLIMRTQSGMVKIAEPCEQVDGYVEFHGVQWDFCHAYILDICANSGSFVGEKKFLADFIKEFQKISFEVIDTTFGYNQTKFAGYISKGDSLAECIIELYYEGDMVYVAEK